jgi:hypothetical protein
MSERLVAWHGKWEVEKHRAERAERRVQELEAALGEIERKAIQISGGGFRGSRLSIAARARAALEAGRKR